MPSLNSTVIASTTTEIQLKPSVRKRLLTELHAYQQMQSTLRELKAKMEVSKAKIGNIREEAGEQSLALEGFTVTLVSPVRSKLNHKKLIALGCAATWIAEATEITPTKSYEKVTCPGAPEEE